MGLVKGIKMIHDELFREGQKEGREEGQREGEQKGLRRAVQSVLRLKFGAQGLQFWEDALEGASFSDWSEILEFAENADTLVEFSERIHPSLSLTD